MNDQQRAAMQMALRKAFDLGQTYWQQADSEYASHWNKADATKAKFEELVDETDAALREALAQPQGEPVAWHEPNAYGNVTTHKKWAEENGWLPLYTKE